MAKRSDNDKVTEGFGAPKDVPKDFLTPWLLLLLHNWSMHGYQLMQMMTISGLAAFDRLLYTGHYGDLRKKG